MPPETPPPSSFSLASEILPASKRKNMQNTHVQNHCLHLFYHLTITLFYTLLLYILHSSLTHSCCWETFELKIVDGSSGFFRINSWGWKYTHAWLTVGQACVWDAEGCCLRFRRVMTSCQDFMQCRKNMSHHFLQTSSRSSVFLPNSPDSIKQPLKCSSSSSEKITKIDQQILDLC